ncbi:hypothetical protein [Brevibacillus fluminis]|uniref:hypothetical protein n=1 Tax=Brevibacillus fluminis TaxID=511487 RepID=UPI00319EAB56
MDNIIKSSIAIGGAAASFLFGGWSTLLSVLLAVVVIDFITDMVAIAHLIDSSLGDQNFIRDVTLFLPGKRASVQHRERWPHRPAGDGADQARRGSVQ